MANVKSFKINDINASINIATDSSDGLMSAQDHKTLSDVSAGTNLYTSATIDDEKIYPVDAIEVIDNPYYIEVKIDSNDSLLESIDSSGKKTFYQDVEIKGNLINSSLASQFVTTDIIYSTESTQYALSVLDSSDNIVFAVSESGKLTDCMGISDAVKTVNTFEDRISTVEDSLSSVTAEIKNIICWGDSLTAAGKYESYLQTALGSSYKVYNCGVGGENTKAIMARCGAVPTFTQRDMVIPADGLEVEISSGTIDTSIFSNLVIKDVDDIEYSINLLRQGGGNSVNPCYLNDIECTLRWSGSTYNDSTGKYYLKRNDTYSYDVTIEAGTEVVFYGFTHRAPYAVVIWIGQNGGYTDEDMLVKQIQATIDQCATVHYVLVGLHTGNASTRQNLEYKMSEAFGNVHYINWREYTATRGIYDAIDNGLLSQISYHDGDDTSIINENYTSYLTLVDSTEYSDVEYMSNGMCPRALLSDSVHHNTAGYTLLGMQIEKRLHYIGAI